MSRRMFFKGIVIATAGVAAACAPGNGPIRGQETPQGADAEPRPLPIPPLYTGELDGDTRSFELTAQKGQFEILPGTTTDTWGFNGAWLGPTLYMRRGEKINMTVHNEVDEPTVVHWHGVHLPAAADGGPALAFNPGESWNPTWTVDQPASTCWYHPHTHGVSALHAYRGLAGGLVIADEAADNAGLPSDYGVDDIPVIITDAKFDGDNLDETIDPTYGLLGNTPVINGITKPFFQAERNVVRLRIVNGATMRLHNLSLGIPMHVVGTDQGLLDAPIEVDSILLTPGERVEVLVDLAANETFTLRSIGVPNNGGLQEGEIADGFGLNERFDLLELRGPAEVTDPSGITVNQLVAMDTLDPAGAVEREFRLNGFQINEQSMDLNRVDFVVEKPGPEVWTVTNENADWPHNFHIHNARFQVLGIDGGELAFTAGWHDTIDIPPLSTVKLLVDIGFYPDPTHAYMYHCHMLFHEDSGMMGQYVVAEPGQTVELKQPGEHGH
ncbi:multicopper oxidase family protein [Corynebacterium sp. LK2510]|uniref:multicopper oxidase family protein n=1 Tax=Corynebacterium sp. LK2510 TaxID=3110472 RepID=UPI0034CFD595